MKIHLASDHTGYEFKGQLKIYLEGLGHEVEDAGPLEYNDADDYPDFVTPMAQSVAKDPGSFGVVLGGSGQGEAMCANRVRGARAVVFYGEALPQRDVDIVGHTSADSFEIVKLARTHNNANIISFGVRFVSFDQIKFATELFIVTSFSGDERHIRRIGKFD